MSMMNPDALNEPQTCPAVGYQSASICVPVTVTPFAQAGLTATKCCGDPVVTPRPGGVRRGEERLLFLHHHPGYLRGRARGVRRGGHRGGQLYQLQRRLREGYLHRLRSDASHHPGGAAPGLTARLRPEPGYAPSAHYLTASRPVRGLLLHPGKKRHRQREPLPV